MKQLLYIGLGGFFGAVSRHMMSLGVHRLFPASVFPWGTFSVNLLGSFLIGLASGIFQTRDILSPELRFLIITGFLGAFTTFSTFSLENVFLLREQHITAAFLNISLQVFLTLAAAWSAYLIGRSI